MRAAPHELAVTVQCAARGQNSDRADLPLISQAVCRCCRQELAEVTDKLAVTLRGQPQGQGLQMAGVRFHGLCCRLWRDFRLAWGGAEAEDGLLTVVSQRQIRAFVRLIEIVGDAPQGQRLSTLWIGGDSTAQGTRNSRAAS